MASNSPSAGRRAYWAPTAIVAAGLTLFALVIGQWVVFGGLDPRRYPADEVVVSFLFTAVPALAVAFGGRWLAGSDLPPDRYPRVGAWCFGGLGVFLGVNLVFIATWPTDSFESNLGWAVGTAIFGAAGGLAIGIVEARAIERARLAERATVSAERAEAEREWFDYLNSILRHEVLNGANVVEGQAALLRERLDDENARNRLETIERRSRAMTSVIRDVRVLIHSTRGDPDLDTVDVSTVLEREVRGVEDTYESIEVEASIPEGAFARADDLLSRVFSNVLENAVEHNGSARPRIAVTLRTTADAVAIEIADNGPGIPPEERETLFERTRSTRSDHGLGLFLVRTLIERYGGTISLADTGQEGSTFEVELPRSSPPPEGPGEPPALRATDGGR